MNNVLMRNGQAQILVVNAGGQYCHLIARRVREAGVEAQICLPETAYSYLPAAKGVIISGGPSSVYSPDAPVFPKEFFEGGLPTLGLCYGHQVLASALGGKVEPSRKREYGGASLELLDQDLLLDGLSTREPVWMSHGDEVTEAPPGFRVLARSASCPIAAMAHVNGKFFGLQFHPEVADTPCGSKIIKNFLFKICNCSKDWEVQGIIGRLRDQIREQVGERHVLFFVSGGVDSTVAFTLCSDTLGPERVTGVFVDTGFMRKGERQEIEQTFSRKGWHNIRVVDASEKFLSALACQFDPEKKRHLIGECFLSVQREVEVELGLSRGGWILAQGTIYPDTIESGFSDKAAVIKTHHNRVPAIEELIKAGLILEPLKEFYKDEVRDIGRQLGLPEELVEKQPFPGPGLAVRCLCSDGEFPVSRPKDVMRLAAKFGLNAWSVPLRTVGVQGDHRSYSNLVMLSGEATLETYSQAAARITREIRGTNRAVFIVSLIDPDGIGKARVHQLSISRKRLDLLREADAVSHELLREAGLAAEVWQFPVVLLPLSIRGGETIALRPVSSSDAMTARHALLPMEFIRKLGDRLIRIDGIEMVLYDVTDKPPATIEWE